MVVSVCSAGSGPSLAVPKSASQSMHYIPSRRSAILLRMSSAKENFGWWIFTHTVAVLFCLAIMVGFSGFNPTVSVQAGMLLLLTVMLPVLVRLAWPTLSELTFLTAPQLILTALSTIGCIVCLWVWLNDQERFWLLFLVIGCAGVTVLGVRHQYRRHLRHTRMLTHVCAACGYDLRASLKRCPECGMPIPEDYRFYLTKDPSSPLSPSEVKPPEAQAFYIPGQAKPTEPQQPAPRDMRPPAPFISADDRGRKSYHRPRIRQRAHSKWAK